MKKKKAFFISLAFSVIIFAISLLTQTKTAATYVSLGDAFVMLSACFIPTNFAMLAALLGCGVATLLISGWKAILPIVLLRVLAACWFMDDEKRILTFRTAVGLGMSAFLFVVGGYLFEVLRLSDFAAPIATTCASALSAACNIVLFLIVAFILDKFKVKERLK